MIDLSKIGEFMESKKSKVLYFLIGLAVGVIITFSLKNINFKNVIVFFDSNFLWFAKVWVPIISATIAFGGVGLTLRNSMHRAKEADIQKLKMLQREVIAKSRLEWLNVVRDTYTEYLNVSYLLINNISSPSTYSYEQVALSSSIKVKLSLLLNDKDDLDAFIMTLLDDSITCISNLDKVRKDPARLLKIGMYTSNFQNNRILMDISFGKYFKMEWTKIKMELEAKKEDEIEKMLTGYKSELRDEVVAAVEELQSEIDKSDYSDKDERKKFGDAILEQIKNI